MPVPVLFLSAIHKLVGKGEREMAYRSKNIGKRVSVPAALAYGTAISFCIILLGAAIIAQMINKEIMGADKMGLGVMILIIAASYLGSKAAYLKIREKRLLISALSGFVVFCLLLCLTVVLFGGKFSGIGVTMLLILCGCGLTALPTKEGGGSGNRRKIKISSR